jgi:hypothetical protein
MQYLGSRDGETGHAQGVVLNINISSLGRDSTASVKGTLPCSNGRYIITASQLLPLLPPPQAPSSCIRPALPPLPVSFHVSLHQPEISSSLLPPPLAQGRASLIMTASPLLPCLLSPPSSLADCTAVSLSLPPPFLDLVARHATAARIASEAQLVVLLLGLEPDAPKDVFSAHHQAAASNRSKFVQYATSSSEIDIVVVSCSYTHMHLMSHWLRAQLHITFATLGACSPPFPSVVHIPRSVPSNPLIPSIASALLSPYVPSDYSPMSPTSRTRIAALAYVACNVSASANAADLAPTIACLQQQLEVSTQALQLQ